MAAVHVLRIDARQVQVWLWRDGLISLGQVFSPDDSGRAEWAAWLDTQAPVPFSLLADVAEEAFQVESIPRLWGRDRRAVLERKLAQFFPGTPLVASRSLGREDGGRRDERVLFLALTRPAAFMPWLSLLEQHQRPCAGLYGTALAAERFARKMRPGARFLLASVGGAGIRMSFFDGGRLCLSHLATTVGEQGESLARSLAAEAQRFHHYLRAQRLVAAESGLPCLVLAHPQDHGAFAGQCRNSPSLEFRLLDLSATAREFGLRNTLTDSSADLFWTHLLALRPPKTRFAAESGQKYFRLWRLGRRMVAASAAACLGGLAYAGYGLWQAEKLEAETARARTEVRALEAAYRARVAGIPPESLPGAELPGLAEAYRSLQQGSAQPRDTLLPISRVLDRFPAIRLQSLDWSNGPESASGYGGKTSAISMSLRFQLVPGPGMDSGGNPATIQSLVQALREGSGAEVSLKTPAGESDASQHLKGDTSAPDAVPVPVFEIQLSRRSGAS